MPNSRFISKIENRLRSRAQGRGIESVLVEEKNLAEVGMRCVQQAEAILLWFRQRVLVGKNLSLAVLAQANAGNDRPTGVFRALWEFKCLFVCIHRAAGSGDEHPLFFP